LGNLFRAELETRVNERFIENLATLQSKAERVAKPEGMMAPGRTGPNGRLRHTLVHAIKSNILPECRDTLFESHGEGVNDNADPIRIPANRIAAMANAGVPVAEINAYLRAQPLALTRRLSLLEAAARRLGESWECDNLNFLDVTVAIGRLQSTFRRHVLGNPAVPLRHRGGSAMIVSAPGDEHGFGLLFIEELFRAAGWSTVLAMPERPEDLLDRVLRRSSAPDVVCISWSSGRLADSLETCLALLRKDFAGAIIAGGGAALANADWLRARGVDLVTGSPQSALDFAKRNQLKHLSRDASEAENRVG
jgi:methylmalonyl-CoA mutase cobalamin-binding subunit